MGLITLTTDWGISDYYVSALKGSILSLSEDVTIVDVSHQIPPFDLLSGAFIFRNAYAKFPNGTVHFIGMDSGNGKNNGLIAIKHKGQYFIGRNDGFFSLVFDEVPQDIVTINSSTEKYTSFDQVAAIQAAVFLAAGKKFNELGNKEENYIQKTHLNPVIEDNIIKGTVIYIDSFENVITNITSSVFERVQKGKKFEIIARRGEYNINTLSEKYSDVSRGQVLALFNSSGYLEIGINQGNAAGLLGMTYGDIVRIDFK